jgi:hypothetical protein
MPAPTERTMVTQQHHAPAGLQLLASAAEMSRQHLLQGK